MLSPADADLARRDRVLSGLPLLLDPDALADALRAAGWDEQIGSIELTYLRYKPATNCIAAYRVQSGPRTVSMYAKAYGTDAPMKLRKARSRSAECSVEASGRLFLEDRGIAVLTFPQDEKLRVLSRLGDPVRRERLLARVFRGRPEAGDGEIETLAYKPERRYVGRYLPSEGRAAVLKFYGAEGYPVAATACRALESRERLRLAKKCGGSKRHRVLAFEWLPGRTLREVLASSAPPLDAVTAAGAAVAELHAQDGAKLPPRRRETELAELCGLADTLGFLCPALAGRANSLTRRVAAGLAGPHSPRSAIHGDLYDKQILLDGDRVAIVDLDRAALGDPRSDLGLFIAHLERDGLLGRLSPATIEVASGSLLEGYQQVTGTRVTGLGAFVADGLLRLAHHPFRSHLPEWQDATERILVRVEEILTGWP